MKTFFELREAKATYCGRCGTTHVPPSQGGTCPALSKEESVNTADKKPETYKDSATGKMKTRMVPVDKEVVKEKTLTPAEKKKREEIARAMERENPGMDMSKKMAIATAAAKRVAEGKERQITKAEYMAKGGASNSTQWTTGDEKSKKYWTRRPQMKEEVELSEGITKMSNARLKYHATKNFPHGSYTRKEIEDEHKRRMKTEPNYHTVKPALESVEQVDEISDKMKDRYISRAVTDYGHSNAVRKDAESRGDKDLAAKMKAHMKKRNRGMDRAFGPKEEEAKPDAAEVMRKKQQMANISTSDKDKLAKIRAMLNKEKK